jgi:hypothetical protein
MPTVAVFDFLSHEFMYHPFNEAYLRLLRAAFPADNGQPSPKRFR